jgi:hypothetical protein
VPLPAPDFVTVSATFFRAKVAVMLLDSLIDTVHVLVPVHAPLQPVNVESLDADAVKITVEVRL